MPPLRQNNFLATPESSQNREVLPSDPFRVLGSIFLAISVFLAAVTYGILYYFENQNINIENNIRDIEASSQSLPLEEMLAFYNKIKSVDSVLRSSNYLTTQLNTLADAVEGETYFKSFLFVTKEKDGSEILISGVTKDESNVVRQMDNFRSDKYKDFIKSVELKNVTSDLVGNTTFDIKLVVNSLLRPDYIPFLEPKSNNPPIVVLPATPINVAPAITGNTTVTASNTKTN